MNRVRFTLLEAREVDPRESNCWAFSETRKSPGLKTPLEEEEWVILEMARSWLGVTWKEV